MAKANERQVGGGHYGEGEYKHWDMVLATGMQYLEGSATKYLDRFEKKGVPVQDLEKALHYIEKAIENASLLALVARAARPSAKQVYSSALRFCDEHNISGQAQSAIMLLATWETKYDLEHAASNVRALLNRLLISRSVPLEDSNKHAERFAEDKE
jgi:hypothetical protein